MRDRVEVVLPGWVSEQEGSCLSAQDDRMRYVVDLARRNVDYGTGGPFAAAVIATSTGVVRSVGVNLVVAEANSTAGRRASWAGEQAGSDVFALEEGGDHRWVGLRARRGH